MKTESELRQKLSTIKRDMERFKADMPAGGLVYTAAIGNFQGAISVLEWILKDEKPV